LHGVVFDILRSTLKRKTKRAQCADEMAGIEDVNRYPVIHKWSYKLAEAA
jgi:hypothetical protein